MTHLKPISLPAEPRPLQRYQLQLVPGTIVTPEPLVTLRPRGDLLMTVHRTQQTKRLS